MFVCVCIFNEANDVKRVGYIHFPHLMQIALLKDYLEIIAFTSAVKLSPKKLKRNNKEANNPMPNDPFLNSRSKIFEMSNILDVAKVNVTFPNGETNKQSLSKFAGLSRV